MFNPRIAIARTAINRFAIAAPAVCVLLLSFACSPDTRKQDQQRQKASTPAGAQSNAEGNVANSPGRDGKTPDHPAPAITAADFAKCDELFAEAKAHYNDAQRARKAGDKPKRFDEAKAGSDRIRDIKALLEVQLGWHEEALLEDWAIPASYLVLEQKFEEWQTMERRLQMMGGK